MDGIFGSMTLRRWALALALAAVGAGPAAADWQSTGGPASADVDTIVDLGAHGTFVGTFNSMAFRRGQHDAAFQRMPDVHGATVFAGTSTTVYAVDGVKGTLLKSSDDGATWSADTPPVDMSINAMFAAGDTLYVIGYARSDFSKVYQRRTDGGAWEAAPNPTSDDPTRGAQCGSTLFVAFGNSGLWSTADAGANWTQILAAQGQNYYLDCSSDGQTVVAANSANIRRSADNGANWASTSPAISGTSIDALKVDASGHIWFASGHDVYRIDTWPTVVSDFVGGELADWDIRVPTYKRAIGSTSGSVLIGTGGSGLFEDSGSGFVRDTSMDVSNVHAVVSTGTSGELFASVMGGGVWHSTDSGATWSHVGGDPDGDSVGRYDATDGLGLLYESGRLWAGADLGLEFSDDGGTNWDLAYFQLNFEVYQVFRAGGALWIRGLNRLYRATDDATFTSAQPASGSFNVNDVGDDGTRVWVVGYQTFMYTDDAATNWVKPDISGTPFASETQFTMIKHAGDAWFLVAGGKLYRSTDSSTWTAVTGIKDTTGYGDSGPATVFEASGGTLYATTGYNGVYASTDGGITWTDVGAGLPTLPTYSGTGTQIREGASIAETGGALFLAHGTEGVMEGALPLHDSGISDISGGDTSGGTGGDTGGGTGGGTGGDTSGGTGGDTGGGTGGDTGGGTGGDQGGQTGVSVDVTTASGKTVTLATDAGTLSGAQAIANPSPATRPTGVAFVSDFYSFEIDGLTVGGSATVTITLPAGSGATTYYKYGPEPSDTSDHFWEFSYDGTTGAEISGDTVTLHLVDGGRGDADGVANGVIMDPGAPALKFTESTGGSGGGTSSGGSVGGCTLGRPGQGADPTLFLLACIAALGVLRRRTAIARG